MLAEPIGWRDTVQRHQSNLTIQPSFHAIIASDEKSHLLRPWTLNTTVGIYRNGFVWPYCVNQLDDSFGEVYRFHMSMFPSGVVALMDEESLHRWSMVYGRWSKTGTRTLPVLAELSKYLV